MLRQAVDEAVRSIIKGAPVRMARAHEAVRDNYIKRGFLWNPEIELDITLAMVAEFRIIAAEAISKAREYDPDEAATHADPIQRQLRSLADATVNVRLKDVQHKAMIVEDARLDTAISNLRNGFQDAIDSALRDLRFHRTLHKGGGPQVTFSDSKLTNVNFAMGDKSQIFQNVTQPDFSHLLNLLLRVKTAAAAIQNEGERHAIIDHVEAVQAELAKEKPEPGKVKRLLSYLGAKATDGAISVLVKEAIEWGLKSLL